MNDLKDGYYWIRYKNEEPEIYQFKKGEWFAHGIDYAIYIGEMYTMIGVVSEWCSDEKEKALHKHDVSFSLRDKIAMHALNGLYASHANPQAGSPIHIDVDQSAEHCYKIADALIKARSNES